MSVRKQEPARGEVYLCQFDPARGSEQAGTRPAVIVERKAFSSVAAKRHVLVAVISTSPECERLPFCIRLEAGKASGLKTTSYLDTSHLHAFSKDRLLKKVGRLTAAETTEMNRALRLILDL